MGRKLMSVPILHGRDIVHARRQVRLLADRLGFDGQDQTRLATAVSEIGRNAIAHAGGGRVEFRIEDGRGVGELVIVVSDTGPGIADVESVLEGRHRSSTSMGLGIAGAKRLVDRLEIETSSMGTVVRLRRRLPRPLGQAWPDLAIRLSDELSRTEHTDPVDEVQRQNRELLESLAALRRREEELMAALRDKEVLLREVYHRVKNNLQIISSLIGLRARKAADPAVRRQLEEVRSRIQSMGLLHEKLYQSEDLAGIDVADYVRDLCAHLRRSPLARDRKAEIVLAAEPVRLPLDQAIHFGLLVTELVGDALRHVAREGGDGDIRVDLYAVPGDRVALRVRDGGAGVTAAPGDEEALGMLLVKALAKGVDGELDVRSGAEGTVVTVTMSMGKPER